MKAPKQGSMLKEKIGEALEVASELKHTEPSRELSLVTTKLEEAAMWCEKAEAKAEAEFRT